jgi:hypothetical protein
MESKADQPIKPQEFSTDFPGTLTKKTTSGDQAWREWVEPVVDVLAKVPDYIGSFFSEFQQPLVTLGIFFLGIITVKVVIAILDALNDIPLLAPLLELVGIGYTAWFVWRYLWKASNRQELMQELEAFKNQILGDKA